MVRVPELARSAGQGNTVPAKALLERLLERSLPAVARHMKRLLRSPSDQDDAAQQVALRLWREAQDLSPEKAFWEVYFARKLKLCCIDAASALWKTTARERQFGRDDREAGDVRDEEANLVDPQEMDTGLLETAALAQLDGDFPARPSKAGSCATCPYWIVCPA